MYRRPCLPWAPRSREPATKLPPLAVRHREPGRGAGRSRKGCPAGWDEQPSSRVAIPRPRPRLHPLRSRRSACPHPCPPSPNAVLSSSCYSPAGPAASRLRRGATALRPHGGAACLAARPRGSRRHAAPAQRRRNRRARVRTPARCRAPDRPHAHRLPGASGSRRPSCSRARRPSMIVSIAAPPLAWARIWMPLSKESATAAVTSSGGTSGAPRYSFSPLEPPVRCGSVPKAILPRGEPSSTLSMRASFRPLR